MEKIQGIIIGRQVYKVVKSDVPNLDCSICDLFDKCQWILGVMDVCIEAIGLGNIFRYSPELTDKIKGGG